VTVSAKRASEYDAVIVGASLAGCAVAIGLGRAGARVALVEQRPDPAAFKRICSHQIQASALPTLERLGLLGPIEAAGAARPRTRIWTRWGWVAAPPGEGGRSVNLRRERLDPLIREAAAATAGVELLLGRGARRLLRDGEGAVAGVAVADPDGEETELRAALTVGADGRDSTVAELAAVSAKARPHGRFFYGAYFEGSGSPSESTAWFLDPQFAAAFPTDGGLCLYVAMPTMELLPRFKRDPGAALVEFLAAVPEPPPIGELRRAGEVLGRIEMPSRARAATAAGLALVGDAALTTDPLAGVGCGWALQSGELLAECVAPALLGDASLDRCLARYRRRRLALRAHAFFIDDYATGRRMNPAERFLFSAAARDEQIATVLDAFVMRTTDPARMMATTPRALAVHARRALGRGRKDEAVAPSPPGG
jgi:menaquinone-9 beta-reductase